MPPDTDKHDDEGTVRTADNDNKKTELNMMAAGDDFLVGHIRSD